MSNRPDGEIITIIGRTRSGKSVEGIKQALKADRLLVVDVQQTWAKQLEKAGRQPLIIEGRNAGQRLARLAAAIKRLGDKPFTIVYHGGQGAIEKPGRKTEAEHNVICDLLIAWQVMAPLTSVHEELRQLEKSSGKAGGGWGDYTTGSLKYGARIIAIMQNPAETDTTCLDQASLVHCCAVSPRARRYAADVLEIPEDYIACLEPFTVGNKDYLPYVRRTKDYVLSCDAQVFDRLPTSTIQNTDKNRFKWLREQLQKPNLERENRYNPS